MPHRSPLITETLTDAELAARAADGDQDAFAGLIRRYEARLINVLLRRVRQPADAEDVAQQAFLRAWQSIDRYEPRWRFSTWLFTIALRHASDVAVKRRIDGCSLATPGTEIVARAAEPGAILEQRESARNLWALADRVLTDDERLALWLRHIEGLASRDIGVVLGRTTTGVRILLHRARQRLLAAAELDGKSASRPAPEGGATARALADSSAPRVALKGEFLR